ncbi:MAG: hypothetical protein OHK0022_54550 [Roseiflexaceae bacterium]
MVSDPAVLRIAKGSAAYRLLRHRYSGATLRHPSEGWREGDVAFLIFDLPTDHGAAAGMALFAVDLAHARLLLARQIETDAAGDQARVTDLYRYHQGASDEPA